MREKKLCLGKKRGRWGTGPKVSVLWDGTNQVKAEPRNPEYSFIPSADQYSLTEQPMYTEPHSRHEGALAQEADAAPCPPQSLQPSGEHGNAINELASMFMTARMTKHYREETTPCGNTDPGVLA